MKRMNMGINPERTYAKRDRVGKVVGRDKERKPRYKRRLRLELGPWYVKLIDLLIKSGI